MGGGDSMVHDLCVHKNDTKKSIVGKKKQVPAKQDSDLEIIKGDSNSEPDSAALKQYHPQAVHVEMLDLEVDTHVASSEDDLDININNNDQEKQVEERPPKAHSTKAQAVAGPSRKVVIQR